MKKMKDYKYHYALHMRCYPSRKQFQTAKRYGGADRFVYNRLVILNNELYQLRKVKIYTKVIADRIAYIKSVLSSVTALKNSAPFLNEIDSQVTLNAKAKYSRAWKNHNEGRAGVPVIHKKSDSFSFQTNPHYKKDPSGMNDCAGFYFTDKNHVVMPGLGRLKIKASPKLISALFERTAETRMGTVTFTCDSTGDCYLSVCLASDEPFVASYEKTGALGSFDLNIDNFLTMNDGTVIENPRFLKQTEEHLKREQRELSRKAERAKKEGRRLSESKNYQKQRKNVAEIHKHIANQRDNSHHKTAADILKTHDYVFAEDLKVKNMLRNHHLAKAIADVGWGGFLSIMEEKAGMRDKFFMKVSPRNTTQTCSSCGHVMSGNKTLTLNDREWTCPECGTHHIRDHNSAINILNRGIAACSP